MEMEKYLMTYEIDKDQNALRVLGEEFVRNNKNKGILIYKNKKYSLKGLFEPFYIKDNKLKIKMLLIKNCYNKSFMFSDCSLLLQFKFYNNIYTNNDILFNIKNRLYISIPETIPNDNFLNINKNTVKNNSEWNTKISAINNIFSNCVLLSSLPDISNWDTSNIFDMSKLFYNCRSLTTLPNISKWNTNNVIDMNKIFYNCFSLLSLPGITKWNIDNIYNMDKMFYNCFSLSSIPAKFKWNDNNNNSGYNFKDCKLLKYIPNIPKRNQSISSMFEKSSAIFKLIYKIEKEKTIKIMDTYFVFQNKRKCKMIINNKLQLRLLKDTYNINDDNEKMLKIKFLILNDKELDLSQMFNECKSLQKFSLISPKDIKLENDNHHGQENNQINIQSIHDSEEINKLSSNQLCNFNNTNIKSLTISSIQNTIFTSKCINKFNIINFSNKNKIFDKEKEKINQIITESKNFLFQSSPLNSIGFQNNINEDNSINANSFLSTEMKMINREDDVEDKTSNEFSDPYTLSSFKSSKRNNINVNNLSYMFYGCSSLISISGISIWNTNSVINMSHMFEKCYSLKSIIGLSQWNTNNIIDISNMFSNCKSLLLLPNISN